MAGAHQQDGMCLRLKEKEQVGDMEACRKLGACARGGKGGRGMLQLRAKACVLGDSSRAGVPGRICR